MINAHNGEDVSPIGKGHMTMDMSPLMKLIEARLPPLVEAAVIKAVDRTLNRSQAVAPIDNRGLSSSEAAPLIGSCIKTARELMISGRLRGFKVGSEYRTTLFDIQKYKLDNPITPKSQKRERRRKR